MGFMIIIFNHKSDNWIILDSPWFRPFLSLIFNIYIYNRFPSHWSIVCERIRIHHAMFFRWSGGLSRWGWAQEITTGPWSRGEVLPHRINELEDDMLWSFLITLDDFWTCLSSWLMLDMLDAEWHPHEIAHFCHVKSIIVHNCSICLFTMPLPILPFPIHFRFFSPPFFLHFCSLNHQPPPHWGINMAPGVCVGGASPPMALRNCRTVGGTQRGW